MDENKAYRPIKNGKKAHERRDYSKVSGSLELPNLVDIQTKSFEWFQNEGLREVFEEIYPIEAHRGGAQLSLVKYWFEKPKFTADECKLNELTYSAPLRATMRLVTTDENTGERITKEEDVFLGDFPILTDTGTFVINGAERVIISQIVRSPGAYFSTARDEKNDANIHTTELIPSRGTWLEFMTNNKKGSGPIIEVSIDRRPKKNSALLLKAIGLSLDIEKGEDTLSTERFKQFMKAMNWTIFDDLDETTEIRDFLHIYLLLYAAVFGSGQVVGSDVDILKNTLVADKVGKGTYKEALLEVYENQRSDEVATLDGAKILMNNKFFDDRRYDLHKAGRYKLGKKLGAFQRTRNHYLAFDLEDENGNLVLPKGTFVDDRDTFAKVRETLAKGVYMHALPMKYVFSHPDTVEIPVSYNKGLVGRILAGNLEAKGLYMDHGTVLTAKDVETLANAGVETVKVYGGIMAEAVTLTKETAHSVLDYGSRLYSLGRLVDENNRDVEFEEDLVIDRYIPDTEEPILTSDARQWILSQVNQGAEYTLYLVGSANQIIYVRLKAEDEDAYELPTKVIGGDPFTKKKTIIISDIYSQYSYLLDRVVNDEEEFDRNDEIDQLGNRRIRTSGELIQNQFRIGLSRMEKNVKEKMSLVNSDEEMTPKKVTNIRSLTMAIKEFFSSSQLSQFMDQQNPLAELTNKRRISALGPSGLSRERAGFEVRDVNQTSYGRICPIETPEGPNIGLINYLASYAKINEYGFIETPYRKVDRETGKVLDDIIYLAADDEMDYKIAPADELETHGPNKGYLKGEAADKCKCRFKNETIEVERSEIELVDVSPKQVISIAAACIPFLENDDATRALMGANMQRQAVPLLKPHSPRVGTGMEYSVARYSGSAVIALRSGIVTFADAKRIIVDEGDGEYEYDLAKFRRSNAGTCINQRPIVSVGERVEPGDVIADGPSMEDGELALGQNVKIAFMTWHGYNYEDAVIMSERMVRDDIFTSIHIEEYSLECRDTKLGPEEITRDIPNVSENSTKNLDARGIVRIGAEVKEGDILVGKTTPKGQSEVSPEEKLLLAIFGEKSRDVRDNSLKVPHGGAGIVQDVRIYVRKKDDKSFKDEILHPDLPPGVNKVVKVFVAQKRKISEGDKMAGRHGNKGVIAKILPDEDMPYLADGTRIDVMLNPFGVPSRMNIGQVFEVHVGLAAEKLGCKFATPVFDGINNDDFKAIMEESNASADFKTVLYDGQTGEPFDERIAVGVMYMIKLAHMVDDKLHARATGPYALVTQQPLGGKAQNGGQRFGEMEVWALEAYGAAYTLSEILTVKSDDVVGRTKTYDAIMKGKPIPEPSIGESFRVLTHELQALALDVKVLDHQGEEIDISLHDDDIKGAYPKNEGEIEPELRNESIDYDLETEMPSSPEIEADYYEASDYGDFE